MRTRPNGFTLVEMAVVLVIIGLLLAGLMMPLSAQVDQRRIDETRKALEEINQALLGYAVANEHLPCPDLTGAGAGTANDGLEDVAAGGACVVQEGNVPWVTLGVAPQDAWNNRFHYAVTDIFSNRGPLAFFTLDSDGTLDVCSTAGCPGGTAIATAVPAVVLSYGRNGFGAINLGGVVNPAPTDANELENTDGDPDFISRTETATYDDLTMWLSPNTLMNRMVTAGRLP